MHVQYLERPDLPKLAYVYLPPSTEGQSLPLVVFLGGYRSDMSGTKATYFEQQCQERGQAYLRFDYSGHGQSEGAFEDGTIGSWKMDALAVLDHVAKGPVVLVGSSMGGWIALLVARARSTLIKGLIGIAAAPDFTEEIFHERLTPEQRDTLMSEGRVEVPNDYSDEPYAYMKGFYEEAKAHLLLDQELMADYPVRLVQGKQDLDVKWETASHIKRSYTDSDVEIIYVEDGDHRLSRDEDLKLIDGEVQKLSGNI